MLMPLDLLKKQKRNLGMKVPMPMLIQLVEEIVVRLIIDKK
jgi:hypothetical protein